MFIKCLSGVVVCGPICTFYMYTVYKCNLPGITEGSVRESNSGDYYYSRVDIFYAGRWGTVCNTAWQLESAQVACRELGETSSLTEIPSYSFR